MKIEQWTVDRVKPYESNPRRNDGAVEAVARSIREYGFRQPIVVDKDGVIVVGHTRLKAALHLGLTEVPVHVAQELTPEQARAYRLADNQLATLSEFDPDLLCAEIAALKALDYDLGLLGWDDSELTELLAPKGNEGLVDPDDVPAPPDAATTQPGELIVLGNHRLLCGDSGSAADLDRLLDGEKIHLCNTDPPYNVKVEPRSNNAIAAGLTSFSRREDLQCGRSTTERGKQDRERLARKAAATHHQKFDVERHPEKAKGTHKKLRAKDRPLANDFVTDEAFDVMLDAWFGNIARVLVPGGA
ncbi:MAG: ParB N-terminal domain-containing protein, partial [Phycisphaeraceae bacterium]|nr:ParB N-terminal domain-containing protein [Phycisphaeraceae bacterium]